MIMLLLAAPAAQAADYTAMDGYIRSLQADSDRVAKTMGIQWRDTYPHASSYYDDLVVHYEDDQLMRDVISQGIL